VQNLEIRFGDDRDVVEIVKGVDASLKETSTYPLLASLDSPEFNPRISANLPHRASIPPLPDAPTPAEARFRRKLLPAQPADPGYARTLTTRLVLATLSQRTRLTTEQIRNACIPACSTMGSRFRSRTGTS